MLFPADMAKYAFAYEQYWRAIEIKDYDGTREIEERGLVVPMPKGTPVLVLEIEEFPKGDPRADAAIVRVLDGPHKGEKGWVAEFDVVRMIDNPDYAK